MKELRKLSIAVPALVLLASLIGAYLTRGAMANLPFLRANGRTYGSRPSGELVDQRPWQTIEALAPLAVSVEEKRLVREAERLADHEVDQAFAQALRQTSLETKTLTGEAKILQQRIATLQAVIKDDQAKLDSLTAASKSSNPPSSDDLDAAKAQVQLDTDELNDANEDFARMIGDKRGQVQQELAIREAAMKKFDEQNDAASAPSSVQTAKRYGTLSGRISAWFDQLTRMNAIAQAQAEASTGSAALTKEHASIESQLSDANTANAQDTNTRSRVARLARMHTLSQIHSILDDRIQTQKQLAAVYGRWMDQVKRQHQIILHLILQSIGAIAFLFLCSAIITAITRKLLNRLKIDRRTSLTLHTIANLAIQIITILLVILVIFGVPSQMPTIIGLVTAGLTVVFQDFILAFFGWFVLMGKKGIRVGDWVEINGVGGEVVEVGLFRTSLLETGNWTDKGHPTGRRTNFMNGFAIRGQYFNFSTSGQWLWDEIRVNIPTGPHTYQIIDAIHNAVRQETEKSTKLAVTEWQRATGAHDMSQFSAEPSVDMRPASSGIDVIIRYVTRASDRFSVRNRLYQTVIELMQKKEEAAALESSEKSN
ncbi:mechanosensitive ion channel family protein [Edaphobacter albus]|uniref:mechanosensitive ion channel family protein n=1 Tax=Edaphobacter sp. 4G125 TaxID=2763071 RepID=UPI001647006B|nr:mechanosensitive ion channel family protein [Edaphobacter sp. 4G125]QNI36483.1 mechanosensitive ion channel [Edaphobacter sp. 4G125]